MLRRRVLNMIDECVVEFSLADPFRIVEDYFTWAFVGVYCPNSDRDRRRLMWDELAGLLNWWNLSSCVGPWGYFNVTHFPSKWLGEAHSCSAILEFFDFIFKRGLMDNPFCSKIFYGVK
jgi:hypothetical protein